MWSDAGDGQTSTGGGQPEFCFAVRKLAAGGNSIEEAILEPGRCVSGIQTQRQRS